jgi:hypothetical protein
MRNSVRVALLAAASLVVIWSFATWAQVIDATPCETSCYDQNTACVSTCSAHGNPVECDAECEDQLRDCLSQCR